VGIEVLPATRRWDDFASFMMPRKPGGRGCICMAYRNSSLDMPGRIAHMRALCESEPGPGVLAYVDSEVAGRCSVAPKSTYRALVNSRTIPHLQDEGAWSVACFVVRPGFRRRGLMHRLLDGAVAHAHTMGATVLEGYPVDPGGERIDQIRVICTRLCDADVATLANSPEAAAPLHNRGSRAAAEEISD
jgi:GNAT superfamily N-acetyltransferase